MAKTPKNTTTLPLETAGSEAKSASKEVPKAANSFEPEAQYRITLKKSVVHAGTMLRPGSDRVVVKGRVAEQIKDAIATAEKL